MPELPEVEVTCRSVRPYAAAQQFSKIIIRQRQLRWPIRPDLAQILKNQTIVSINRRAKYILFTCTNGTLIVHLGMSGKLSVLLSNVLANKHDHVDFILHNGYVIRYTDPRRFGSIVWTTADPKQHKLLAHLGVEPLTKDFTGQFLFAVASKKKTPIKTMLMDAAIVVGIGNIYANEALFAAGILPVRAANTITLPESLSLVKHSRRILRNAIHKGGTTLQDFFNVEGKPGYFSQNLMVYGRAGELCYNCNAVLQEARLNKRTTVFCPQCQH